MPAQPAWFHRLEEIRDELDRLEPAYLDRLAVQKLFGVQERRARQLMAGLPALRFGNAVAVERTALLARLQGIGSSHAFQCEKARRARVAEHLDRTRRQLAARKVRIEAPLPQRPLLDGIDLRPGELRICFATAEELAARLFQLSRI